MLTSISSWGGSRRQETDMRSSYPSPLSQNIQTQIFSKSMTSGETQSILNSLFLGSEEIYESKLAVAHIKNSLWIEVPDWLVFKPPQQTTQIIKHRNFTQKMLECRKMSAGGQQNKKTSFVVQRGIPYLKLSDISGRGNLRFNQAPNNSINSLHSPTKSPCSPICPPEMINSRWEIWSWTFWQNGILELFSRPD